MFVSVLLIWMERNARAFWGVEYVAYIFWLLSYWIIQLGWEYVLILTWYSPNNHFIYHFLRSQLLVLINTNILTFTGKDIKKVISVCLLYSLVYKLHLLWYKPDFRKSEKQELWVDKYKPFGLEELAVHKKKASQISLQLWETQFSLVWGY